MDQIADVNLANIRRGEDRGRSDGWIQRLELISGDLFADVFKQLFYYANYNPWYRSGKVRN